MLTQNEQQIIKYVGQNYLTKAAMANVIPCQTMPSAQEYAAAWLSKDGKTPLIPIQGAFYMVTNLGEIYQWSGTTYERANLPDSLTKQEVTNMWN